MKFPLKILCSLMIMIPFVLCCQEKSSKSSQIDDETTGDGALGTQAQQVDEIDELTGVTDGDGDAGTDDEEIPVSNTVIMTEEWESLKIMITDCKSSYTTVILDNKGNYSLDGVKVSDLETIANGDVKIISNESVTEANCYEVLTQAEIDNFTGLFATADLANHDHVYLPDNQFWYCHGNTYSFTFKQDGLSHFFKIYTDSSSINAVKTQAEPVYNILKGLEDITATAACVE